MNLKRINPIAVVFWTGVLLICAIAGGWTAVGYGAGVAFVVSAIVQAFSATQ